MVNNELMHKKYNSEILLQKDRKVVYEILFITIFFVHSEYYYRERPGYLGSSFPNSPNILKS